MELSFVGNLVGTPSKASFATLSGFRSPWNTLDPFEMVDDSAVSAYSADALSVKKARRGDYFTDGG